VNVDFWFSLTGGNVNDKDAKKNNFYIVGNYAPMKKIVYLLFSSCMLLGLHVSAQRQDTYFLKNNGEYLVDADSADFIRLVREPEKRSKLYLTKEFYISGKRKSTGYSSRIQPPIYEGQFISFYENGRKKQILNYVKGKITDTAYRHFPNGRLHTSMFHKAIGDSSVVYIKSVRDSTGASLVTNGNGYAVLYDDDFNYIMEKGMVKNGKRDGEWTGELGKTDTLRYKEMYADGKLLSGESTDAQGNVYHYTIAEVKPNFKGGLPLFYRQALREFRGAELAKQGVQGIAHLRFTILTNGEISDLRVTNYPDPLLAAEAIRTIKAIKGWQPGSYRGRQVNLSQTARLSINN